MPCRINHIHCKKKNYTKVNGFSLSKNILNLLNLKKNIKQRTQILLRNMISNYIVDYNNIVCFDLLQIMKLRIKKKNVMKNHTSDRLRTAIDMVTISDTTYTNRLTGLSKRWIRALDNTFCSIKTFGTGYTRHLLSLINFNHFLLCRCFKL